MKVLVVIDMQKDFIYGSLGSKAAESIVDGVCGRISEASKNGECLYVTMDTHGDDYMNTLEGKKLPIAHCIRGTEGWELDDNVINAINEYKDNAKHNKNGEFKTIYSGIFQKNTFGSYKLCIGIEQLSNFLSSQNDKIESIEVCGLCTDICVVSNAMMLRATFPNVPIYVNEHLCAGVTKESHDAAITTMKSCQIDVI